MAGVKDGNYGLPPRDGTGWTSYRTLTNVFRWLWLTNGAGRCFARRMSLSPGMEAGPEGSSSGGSPQFEPAIKSQFGAGIVTFSPPWLFRTPPGWDLYLKGPSNRWKPNCVPLEGVIETWWLNYTFTLNWKLVQPGTVVFRQGESLGQLLPVPHLTFEDATATGSTDRAARTRKRPRSFWSGRKNGGRLPRRRTTFITCTARLRESRNIFNASTSRRSRYRHRRVHCRLKKLASERVGGRKLRQSDDEDRTHANRSVSMSVRVGR